MSEAARNALILKFYDTLNNPSSWQEALDEFAQMCGADAASLMVGDNVYLSIDTRTVGKRLGGILDNFEEYAERFGEAEVAAFGVVFQKPVQTWVSDEEAFGKPVEEIGCALYQRDNHGVFRRSATQLNVTPIWSDGIVLHFNKDRGNLTEDEETTSRQFLPHIAKVVELGRPFSLLRQRYAGVLGVLDMLRLGVVITTPQGHVALANRRAEDILRDDTGIFRGNDGRLGLSDPNKHEQLQSQLLATASENDQSRKHAVLATPRRDNGGQWILETFCLPDSSGGIDGQLNGACTFIIDPHQADLVSATGMQKVFRLTAAETEICELLGAGYRVDDIASHRNVSPGTVRTQVKSLFDKTNSRSQVDLVRQALWVNLPVSRPDPDA